MDGGQQGGAAGGLLPPLGRGAWARLADVALGKNALALADQAVVSGTSFLTTILIGRWCGAEELGVYCLGASLLVAVACVQESLIALPYTISRHRAPEQGTQEEYAGGVLVQQGLLSALALVVLAAAALVLSAGGAIPSLAAVTWALALVTPAALLREFGRRFAFARLCMAQALVLDAAVAAVQLAGLAWLVSAGALSATAAYAVIGAACAVSGAVWLYQARGSFAVRRGRVRPALRQSWSLGKWLFACQATLSVQAYFIHWLLAWLVGPTATGVYAACLTVPLFANPLILGLANALAPRAAHALNEGGHAELRRVVFQTTRLVGAAMVLFCLVVALWGEGLMDWLYRGPQYQGHGTTVTLLALAMLTSALGMPASNGLMAAERPDVVFKVALVALSVAVVLVPGLVAWWGLTGAAAGYLAGSAAGAVGRWAAFLALVPRPAPKAGLPRAGSELPDPAVLRVLRQLTQRADADGGWVIERVGEGVEASVYAVRSRTRQAVWGTHECLVVKLYKPTAGSAGVERVREEFASLARLHEAVNGSAIKGWTACAPAPLYVSESPLALVMTLVPGRELDWYLETDAALTPEQLESAAGAVAAAMKGFWSLGQLYGALSFCNILCDSAAGTLSFVDVGLEADSFLCDGVSKDWYPASRDLAYMLYQTGVRVRTAMSNPCACLRQRRFSEDVLRAFLGTVDSAEEKRRLLDEIQACVRVHLRTLGRSWSPRGLWHMVLRRIAARRIEKQLARLRSDSGAAQ